MNDIGEPPRWSAVVTPQGNEAGLQRWPYWKETITISADLLKIGRAVVFLWQPGQGQNLNLAGKLAGFASFKRRRFEKLFIPTEPWRDWRITPEDARRYEDFMDDFVCNIYREDLPFTFTIECPPSSMIKE